MDYHTAIQYLQALTDFEKSPAILYDAAKYDLRRLRDLLGRLGQPHLAAPTVHIAGTKGKGSTAALIAAVLQEAGYRVGLNTSPHLHSFRERITVNGQLISPEEFAAAVETALPHIEAINAQPLYGRISWFEAVTVAAFLHFARQKVDLQVLETGLGGRLDATNVVPQPLVSVITSISLDHTQILGDTIAKIAREKAGIIKPGRPVVSSPQAPEALAVLEEVARARQARLLAAGRDIRWRKDAASPDGQAFTITGRRGSYRLETPLLGDHQIENGAAAVGALELLQEQGLAVTPEAIARGFLHVHWPGRLQILGQRPWLVADGAHNVDSARRLVEALRDYFAFDRAILVAGVSVDKDLAGMASQFAGLFSQAIATRSHHRRGAEPAELAALFKRAGMAAETAPTVEAALTAARAHAGAGDLICATGSLFVVAEAIECLTGVKPEPAFA